MPIHDWTRVSAGTFHHFHMTWITHLSEMLNDGLLPSAYYAMVEQHAGKMIPDVLTLQTEIAPEWSTESRGGSTAVAESPPKTSHKRIASEDACYRLARRTLAIRHTSDHRIAAMIEIVSPANKDRASSVADFTEKAIRAIRQQCHVMVVDLLPPGKFDPHGMHGQIWQTFDPDEEPLPAEKPLVISSYAAFELPEAYVEALAVGDSMPDMPLFLHPEWYLKVPLQPAYDLAYRGMPAFWRDVIEGSNRSNAAKNG